VAYYRLIDPLEIVLQHRFHHYWLVVRQTQLVRLEQTSQVLEHVRQERASAERHEVQA
jgi:hypothetical protein